jgi:hypothetical protein
MSENHKLLDDWLMKTLADNPDVIKESKTSIDVYSKLWEIWLEDCQAAMKRLASEVIKPL